MSTTALERLKEYKELIGIITGTAMILGWLYTKFPTKDELDTVECRVEAYTEITQLQLENKELEDDAEKLVADLMSAESGSADSELSPAMRLELSDLQSEYEHNKEKKRQNSERITEILDALARHDCRKVVK